MHMAEIIAKKKYGRPLTRQEISFVVNGFTNASIPDYQMSAFLMAVWFQGMDADETGALTLSMAESGEQIDLSPIAGIKVDKHSTGGVGDKTTLIAGPIAAACGIPVAKMSGRGLGHTGGTIDKLESIPGFRVSLTPDEFIAQTNKIGICLVGQSGNLAPADKLIYALRDVTGTVDSLPLIASSIMSKKIAAGTDAILLDVKTGGGALMKREAESRALALEMIRIGCHTGRDTRALITNMDIPLGYCIGNSLEIIESVAVLQGKGPRDLEGISLEIAACMLLLANSGTLEECRTKAREALTSGRALNKFVELTEYQGGDCSYLTNPDQFPKSPIIQPLRSRETGYLSAMDTEAFGYASVLLGAGRQSKDDGIDYAAGIVLAKKPGDYVLRGEALAWLHTSTDSRAEEAAGYLAKAVSFCDNPPKQEAVILSFLGPDDL